MADWKTSEYTTSIGIKPIKKKRIEEIKGKKSRAGKLDEIIDFYLNKHKLWK